MLKQVLERPVVDDANGVGACQHNGKAEQSPFINQRASRHFADTIERKDPGVDILKQWITCMRPDSGYSCAPGYSIYIAVHCCVPYTYTGNVGDGVERA